MYMKRMSILVLFQSVLYMAVRSIDLTIIVNFFTYSSNLIVYFFQNASGILSLCC